MTMGFFLVVFLGLSVWTPWWAAALFSFLFASFVKMTFKKSIGYAFSAGVIWIALAFYFDLQAHSLVSARMIHLFGLSSSAWLYAFTGLIAMWSTFWALLLGSLVPGPKTGRRALGLRQRKP